MNRCPNFFFCEAVLSREIIGYGADDSVSDCRGQLYRPAAFFADFGANADGKTNRRLARLAADWSTLPGHIRHHHRQHQLSQTLNGTTTSFRGDHNPYLCQLE